MAYRYENNDIVIDGWEKGIQPSPHSGLGSIKCANVSTETDVIMCNYSRKQLTQNYTVTATLTEQVTPSQDILYTSSDNSYILAGSWVTISSSTMPQVPNGTYWIAYSYQSGTKKLGLAYTYNGTAITLNSGVAHTANLTFLANASAVGGIMATPVQSATEFYNDSSGNLQNRYYILDSEGHVWVNDTAVATAGMTWAQIDTATARSSASLTTTAKATGLAVYNGWLFLFIQDTILCKFTAELGINITALTITYGSTPTGTGWVKTGGIQSLNTPTGINNPHFAYTSKAGALYWVDGSFVGSLFATAGTPNLWSSASYVFSTTTLTVSTLINGVKPYGGMPIDFFSNAGTSNVPTGVTAGATYYVKVGSVTVNSGNIQFQVAATPTGSAISLSGGSGTQYFTTFDPTNTSTYIFSPQALTIPQQQDIAQCLTEIGSNILIGCKSNTVYFWDGFSTTPNGFLFLPEQNVTNMITVNNMAYVFAGSRGNIYITNGNTSSLVVTVPDYITGQITPYFTWGGVMYSGGKVWFSINDENAVHSGTCGGIWSFTPTQNLFIGQDTGLALKLENQSSYGTYNGVANVLIHQYNQNALGSQYYSAWTSDSVSGATYGIDGSSQTPYTSGQTVIETDMIPVGDYLDKGNFTSVNTKYSAKLVSGESVQLKWRTSLTDSWNAFTDTKSGTDSVIGSLGNTFEIPFSNIMMIQFQIILTSTSSSPSFVRLKELRLRKIKK